MARRTATVLQVARVSVPNSGADALRILTDLPWSCDKAFHLRPDSPEPEVGSSINWGTSSACYEVGGVPIVARKIGYDFDPDAPLR